MRMSLFFLLLIFFSPYASWSSQSTCIKLNKIYSEKAHEVKLKDRDFHALFHMELAAKVALRTSLVTMVKLTKTQTSKNLIATYNGGSSRSVLVAASPVGEVIGYKTLDKLNPVSWCVR